MVYYLCILEEFLEAASFSDVSSAEAEIDGFFFLPIFSLESFILHKTFFFITKFLVKNHFSTKNIHIPKFKSIKLQTNSYKIKLTQKQKPKIILPFHILFTDFKIMQRSNKFN
jgi:hypothetical protein